MAENKKDESKEEETTAEEKKESKKKGYKSVYRSREEAEQIIRVLVFRNRTKAPSDDRNRGIHVDEYDEFGRWYMEHGWDWDN